MCLHRPRHTESGLHSVCSQGTRRPREHRAGSDGTAALALALAQHGTLDPSWAGGLGLPRVGHSAGRCPRPQAQRPGPWPPPSETPGAAPQRPLAADPRNRRPGAYSARGQVCLQVGLPLERECGASPRLCQYVVSSPILLRLSVYFKCYFYSRRVHVLMRRLIMWTNPLPPLAPSSVATPSPSSLTSSFKNFFFVINYPLNPINAARAHTGVGSSPRP